MFHLSLPVASFPECLAFYRDCFDARAVMLDKKAANLFVFGGQLTLHDKPDNALGEPQRREMHFGHVVSEDEWRRLRARVERSERPILGCREPSEDGRVRGKLLVLDPAGNLVEINSGALEPPAS